MVNITSLIATRKHGDKPKAKTAIYGERGHTCSKEHALLENNDTSRIYANTYEFVHSTQMDL